MGLLDKVFHGKKKAAEGQQMKIHSNITELAGNTPLVELRNVKDGAQATVAAKLESLCPLASVKDRIAVNIINEAEKRGELVPGKHTIVEITSGNTGIGMSMTAAAKGYKCVAVMPDVLSTERRMIMLALGCQLILTEGMKGLMGAMDVFEEVLTTTKDAFMLNQFASEDNPGAHYKSTGPEIWRDTAGKVDIFIAGVGTGGTVTGTGRYLKEQNPAIQVIAVEPMESAVLSGGDPGKHGIQGIGAGVIPPLYDASVVDEVVKVSTEESLTMARRLATQEGILAGISSGAAAAAAVKVASRPENAGKLIVVIFPSSGERYMSTDLYKDVREKAVTLSHADTTVMDALRASLPVGEKQSLDPKIAGLLADFRARIKAGGKWSAVQKATDDAAHAPTGTIDTPVPQTVVTPAVADGNGVNTETPAGEDGSSAAPSGDGTTGDVEPVPANLVTEAI